VGFPIPSLIHWLRNYCRVLYIKHPARCQESAINIPAAPFPPWSWEPIKEKREQITTKINRNGYTAVSNVKKRRSSYCRLWLKKINLWEQSRHPGEKRGIKLRHNEQIRIFQDQKEKMSISGKTAMEKTMNRPSDQGKEGQGADGAGFITSLVPCLSQQPGSLPLTWATHRPRPKTIILPTTPALFKHRNCFATPD